ncbi:DUF721 domain-containing protein [Pelagibius litoralis]|uniref:DUF721 domain-containing protein n=1 Tax=Pelagibius litoralis TaxID=374515 RepID=A0A967F290_9PROT|nr:DciA family protein [Pelagibius litoralis]NIA71586.1 DUF721 domain-containing protein [Pelagibius litoralis]
MSKTGNTPYARPPERKRRSSLRALSASLSGVTKRAFARRGLSGGELARQWPTIVGADLASQCQPRKLRFPKPGEAVNGALTLRVAPAWALEIQHLENVLLDRINGFFGYRAVARLILQQGPLSVKENRGRAAAKAAAALPLPPADSQLTAKLSTVEDPDLRSALERLGRSLRQKQARKPKRP